MLKKMSKDEFFGTFLPGVAFTALVLFFCAVLSFQSTVWGSENPLQDDLTIDWNGEDGCFDIFLPEIDRADSYVVSSSPSEGMPDATSVTYYDYGFVCYYPYDGEFAVEKCDAFYFTVTAYDKHGKRLMSTDEPVCVPIASDVNENPVAVEFYEDEDFEVETETLAKERPFGIDVDYPNQKNGTELSQLENAIMLLSKVSLNSFFRDVLSMMVDDQMIKDISVKSADTVDGVNRIVWNVETYGSTWEVEMTAKCERAVG